MSVTGRSSQQSKLLERIQQNLWKENIVKEPDSEGLISRPIIDKSGKIEFFVLDSDEQKRDDDPSSYIMPVNNGFEIVLALPKATYENNTKKIQGEINEFLGEKYGKEGPHVNKDPEIQKGRLKVPILVEQGPEVVAATIPNVIEFYFKEFVDF